MGGFDLFVSEKQSDGTWGKPENMGWPINSVGDDIYIVMRKGTESFYFSSDRPGGYGEKDIYFVDLPEEMEAEGLTVLKGFIIPPPGQELPPSTILYVTDKSTGETKAYKPRQRDGVYVGSDRAKASFDFRRDARVGGQRHDLEAPQLLQLGDERVARSAGRRRGCPRARVAGRSIPSRINSSSRRSITTCVPPGSSDCGIRKVPRSNRLYRRHQPVRSHHRSLTWVRARLTKR